MRRSAAVLVAAVLMSASVCAGAVAVLNLTAQEFEAPRPPKINRVRVKESITAQLTRKSPAPEEVGNSGEVVLAVVIGKDGKVLSAKRLSGDERLAEAGKKAVMKWEYSPYFLNGDPVEVETTVTLHFKGLKG